MIGLQLTSGFGAIDAPELWHRGEHCIGGAPWLQHIKSGATFHGMKASLPWRAECHHEWYNHHGSRSACYHCGVMVEHR